MTILKSITWFTGLILAALIVAVSCSQPTGVSPSTPTVIDTSDPISVLQAIPDTMALAEGVDSSNRSAGITRNAVFSRASSIGLVPEVFHNDVPAVPGIAAEDIDNASMSYAINLILKNISQFPAPKPKADGELVTLGDLDLSDSIAQAINLDPASNTMTYHGVIINRIEVGDSPNGTQGFSYFLPVSFNHINVGEVTAYAYFEVFTHDANNMEMRYVTYVENPFIPDTYLNWMNSTMKIVNGKQSIRRFENDITNGNPDYWWFQAFENDPATGKTSVATYNSGNSSVVDPPYTVPECWSLIAFDNNGGIMLGNSMDGSNINAEYYTANGDLMALLSDIDAGAMPADISSFVPDSGRYGYRYLEDNLGDSTSILLTDTNYQIDYLDPATYESFKNYPSLDVSDVDTSQFLLGDTNNSIISSINSTLSTEYSEMFDYFDGSYYEKDLDGNDAELGLDVRMSPVYLGVSDHDYLTGKFNEFGL